MRQQTLFAAESLLHEGQRAMTTERLLNTFAETAPRGRNPVTVRSAPGLANVVQLGLGRIWGLHSAHGLLYANANGRLVSWDGSAVTDLGALSRSHTTFASNATQLAVASGGEYKVLDGGALSTVSPGFFTGGTATVAYINSRGILSGVDTDRWGITAGNDLSTIDPLEFATAEYQADNILRIITNNGLVHLLGAETIEVWQDVGGTDFPFLRISGNIPEKGLRSAGEADKLDNTIMWVSNEPKVYRVDQFQPIRLSTHAVDASIKTAGAGVVFPFQYQGHDFLVVRPESRPAWVYAPATQSWHERTSGTDYGPWNACASVQHQGEWYLGTIDGHICTPSGFQDQGDEMRREVTSSLLNLRPFGVNGASVEAYTRLEVGNGGTVIMQRSDNARTWSRERTRSLGAVGEYGTEITWPALGQFREFAMRLICTDNVDFAVYDAGVNLS